VAGHSTLGHARSSYRRRERPHDLERLVGATLDEYGRLDVVVNNAGGSMPAPLLDTSVRQFEQAFHFNVTTAFALSLAASHMLAGDGGTIVNISSAMGRLRIEGMWPTARQRRRWHT